MTVIIGLEDGGKVWMGGDREAQTGYVKVSLSTPKVFSVGQFIFGLSGEPRIGDWLQSGYWPIPTIEPTLNPQLAVIAHIVEPLAQRMREVEVNDTPTYMVGYQGALFMVDGFHNAVRPANGLFAIGSGGEVAHGVMLALAHLPPFERISQALAITKTLAVGCGGDSDIISL